MQQFVGTLLAVGQGLLGQIPFRIELGNFIKVFIITLVRWTDRLLRGSNNGAGRHLTRSKDRLQDIRLRRGRKLNCTLACGVGTDIRLYCHQDPRHKNT